ncbi:trypsin-2-like isoform X2 [Cimex lectularius]|uniref:Peptidase S1 domain-containing protein n=1 Tax=Cimex lectularius TaxID=79782 RepID=A0A8I6S1K9_CIMLE|nr:trypsin-2-like isoform X2 [Cimex lectularius]
MICFYFLVLNYFIVLCQSTVEMNVSISNCTVNVDDDDYYYANTDLLQTEANKVRTTIYYVPYMVRLLKKRKTTCSGSIINASWILTAAHCLPHSRKLDSIEIMAGVDDVEDYRKAQFAMAKRVIQHPNYIPSKISKYDLGLIELVEPLNLSSTVQVLPLTNNSWPSTERLYSQPCLAAGWGTDKIVPGGVRKLRTLNVLAKHGDEACSCWRSFHNRRLICLAEPGKGICHGDTGGPLVCDGKGVGVAHALYRRDTCQMFHVGPTPVTCKDSTSTYMYLCPELSWIKQYVSNVPETPLTCKGTQTIFYLNALLTGIITVFVLL